MKKKILIGTVNMEIGGIEKSLIGILKNIDYEKYDVDLLLLKTNGAYINDIPNTVNIITPYRSKIMESICNSKNIVCKIIKHLFYNHFVAFLYRNKKQYDTAISYSGYYPFIDYYIKNSKSKKKLIWVHTDISTFDGKYIYRLRYLFTKNKYKYFDSIVCVSESIRNCFNSLLPKYKNKTKVLWNIVDIKKEENDKKIPKLNGDFIIVSVGRLCESKRFDKLAFVHKKLIRGGIKVKTYIVGEGEEREKLENLINKYKIKDTFILLGEQIDIKSIIRQADLFVLTSDYEGFGIVLLEALDSNIPFIGTKVYGIKDIARYIAPEGSSLIVNNNITAIYEGIVDAMNGKVNKNFKFNISDYNKKCIKDFYELLKQ